MAFDREAARLVRNQRRCEEISWSLFFGAMMKLVGMQSWPLLVATSWGIFWACFLVIGRATFGMPWARPVGPRIGARSAVMIAIVVSILLVPPLLAVLEHFVLPLLAMMMIFIATAADGFMVGVIFPLTCRLYDRPGLLYAMDLLGACAGTVLISLILIPVLGLLINLYLMSQLGITNWLRFLIWLVIGLVLVMGDIQRSHIMAKDHNAGKSIPILALRPLGR